MIKGQHRRRGGKILKIARVFLMAGVDSREWLPPPSDISTNQVYLAIILILNSIKTLEDLAPPVDEINSVFGDHMLLWRIVVPSQYLGR